MRVWSVYDKLEPGYPIPVAAPTRNKARVIGAAEMEMCYLDVCVRATDAELDASHPHVLTDKDMTQLGFYYLDEADE